MVSAARTYENDPQSKHQFYVAVRSRVAEQNSNGCSAAVNELLFNGERQEEVLRTLKPRFSEEFIDCQRALAAAFINPYPTEVKTKSDRANFIKQFMQFFSTEHINFWRVQIALEILKQEGKIAEIQVVKKPLQIKYWAIDPKRNVAPTAINLEISSDSKYRDLVLNNINSFKINPKEHSITDLAEILTGTLRTVPYADRNIFDDVIENCFKKETYIQNSNNQFKKQLRKLLYDLSQDLLTTGIPDSIIYKEWFKVLLKDELDTKALEKIQKYFNQDPSKNIFLNTNHFYLLRMKIALLKYNSETKQNDHTSVVDLSSEKTKIRSWLNSKTIIGKISRNSSNNELLDLFLLSTKKGSMIERYYRNRKKIFCIGDKSISEITKALTTLTAIPKNNFSEETKQYLKRQYMFLIESQLRKEPYISKIKFNTDLESAKKFFEPIINFAITNFRTKAQFQLVLRWIEQVSSSMVSKKIDKIFVKLAHIPSINHAAILSNFKDLGEARINFLLALLQGRGEINNFKISHKSSYWDILGIDAIAALDKQLLLLQIKSNKSGVQKFRSTKLESGKDRFRLLPIDVINCKRDLGSLLQLIRTAIKSPNKLISETEFNNSINLNHRKIFEAPVRSRFQTMIWEMLEKEKRSSSFEERERLLEPSQ